jgi:hypothetical protein
MVFPPCAIAWRGTAPLVLANYSIRLTGLGRRFAPRTDHHQSSHSLARARPGLQHMQVVRPRPTSSCAHSFAFPGLLQ